MVEEEGSFASLEALKSLVQQFSVALSACYKKRTLFVMSQNKG